MEYDPYGRARRNPPGDFNHSGSISLQDLFDFLGAQAAGSPSADINTDGGVGPQDIFDFMALYFAPDQTPTDRISGLGPTSILIDNPYGYCGYYFDSETAAAKVLGPLGGALYQVRYRVYDPIAGRWLTRDPAGFVDGGNLYEYCMGQATGCWDPWGLVAMCADDLLDSLPLDGSSQPFRGQPNNGEGIVDRETSERIAREHEQYMLDAATTLAKASVNTVAVIGSFVTGPWTSAALTAINTYVQSGSLSAASRAGVISIAISKVLGVAPEALKRVPKKQIEAAVRKIIAGVEETIGRTLTEAEQVMVAEGRAIGAATAAEGRAIAKDWGNIPRSQQPVAQGVSKSGKDRWWEYVDSNGERKIVVEHADGSVHVGTPKPQSTHRDAVNPGAPRYTPVPDAPDHIFIPRSDK